MVDFSKQSNSVRKIILASALLVSCTKGPDCLVSDQNGFLDSKELDKKTYHLYYKVTGWHEKTVFIFLYDKKPAFDSCGRADIDAVDGIDVEPGPKGHVSKVKLLPRENGKGRFLQLTYTHNQTMAYASYQEIRISE